MNNLWGLVKTTFIHEWGLNSFSKHIGSSKEKKKLLFSASTFFVAAIVIGYLATLYSLLLADGLEQIGFLPLLLIVSMIGATFVVFFTSIYKAQGTLFSSKDYDLLMSLPIKSSVILTSKLINLLLMNYLFVLFTVLPPALVYVTRTNALSISYFIILIVSVLCIPLIPIIFSSIIGIVIAYLSSKFKYKNITTIIGTMILFMFVMIGSYKMNDVIASLMSKSESIMEAVGKFYPPALYFTNSLVDTSYIELLKLMGISIIPFALFIIVFSKAFKRINAKLGESYRKGNYEVKTLQVNSPLKALIIKEARRFFSTPIYVLNTAIGMVIVLVASIATFFIKGETLAMYLSIPYVGEIFPLMILVLVSFGIGMSCTSCSSVSLEGKNLWVIKSLPIEVKTIFMSKIGLNLLITIPASILANVFFFIGLKFDSMSLVWNIIISILFAFVSAIAGLCINLYFPKLDFTSPTTVVKQSASVLLSMVFTFACLGLPIGAFILLKVENITVFLSSIVGCLVLLLIGFLFLLNKQGKAKFKAL